MKRTLTVTLVLLLCLGALFAQGAKEPTDGKTIKKLSVYYVPSREPAEIITVTVPLKELLIAQLVMYFEPFVFSSPLSTSQVKR